MKPRINKVLKNFAVTLRSPARTDPTQQFSFLLTYYSYNNGIIIFRIIIINIVVKLKIATDNILSKQSQTASKRHPFSCGGERDNNFSIL
jgi:hypothetical protein